MRPNGTGLDTPTAQLYRVPDGTRWIAIVDKSETVEQARMTEELLQHIPDHVLVSVDGYSTVFVNGPKMRATKPVLLPHIAAETTGD